MPDLEKWLHYGGEAVKIIGGFASFYAVIKLRQIEQRYLFKATIPELVNSIQSALDVLSESMHRPSDHQVRIAEALNLLIVDVRNVKKKARSDSLQSANRLLKSIGAMRPPRYFWQNQTHLAPTKVALLDVYGQGMGLIRSLENDLNDQGWSAK